MKNTAFSGALQDRSSVVRLSSFGLESALLEESNGNDLFGIPAVDSLPACRTIAFAAIVVLLGRHESARQAFVAKDVTCMYCQSGSQTSILRMNLPQIAVVALV
jgi:hypothetical protein